MQVTVTGRHFEVTSALRTHLDVRLRRMHRFLGKWESAHVTLSAEKHRCCAEIVLHAAGRDFTCKDVSEDMFSALDRVADKMDKQLQRFKDKRASARKNAGRVNGANGMTKMGTLRVLRAGTTGRGANEHDVVEAADYPIDVLSVDEAIARLEENGERFLVFANRATELIHVVYRLEDGNYGVVNLHAAS
jgi:putative sigma-54 modulation protein